MLATGQPFVAVSQLQLRAGAHASDHVQPVPPTAMFLPTPKLGAKHSVKYPPPVRTPPAQREFLRFGRHQAVFAARPAVFSAFPRNADRLVAVNLPALPHLSQRMAGYWIVRQTAIQ